MPLDKKYEKSLIELKRFFYNELKLYRGTLSIINGELQSEGWNLVNMKLYQSKLNEILGQKQYAVVYSGSHEVYAQSEDQARIFANQIGNTPLVSISSVQELKS